MDYYINGCKEQPMHKFKLEWKEQHYKNNAIKSISNTSAHGAII
jgi:hypothetical protein